MAQACGYFARHTFHNAYIESSPKLLYPFHPLYGTQIEVLGGAGGKRDMIYVRLPDQSTRGLPAWMFDALFCANIRTAIVPQIDFAPLQQLAGLLESWKADKTSVHGIKTPSGDQYTQAGTASIGTGSFREETSSGETDAMHSSTGAITQGSSRQQYS